MKRIVLFTTLLALGLLYTLSGSHSVALADGSKGVVVQPLTPEPGEVITVKGDLLGPNSTVEVRLIGKGVDIDLGEVQADAEGDFTAQFRLPEDLEPGDYKVQATGAESATAEITVVAPAAGATGVGTMEQAPAPVLRQRPLGESTGLVALFGLLAALGLFFARAAREQPAREQPARHNRY